MNKNPNHKNQLDPERTSFLASPGSTQGKLFLALCNTRKDRKCKLCNNQYDKLSKSHIFPIGFFKNIPSKGRVDTITLGGEKGRKLQKAIWDTEILCFSCKHDIMEPLDDYGIKVFRDKLKSFIVETPTKHRDIIIVFEDIDQTKLRAFLASILWRVSTSKQKEVKNCSQ